MCCVFFVVVVGCVGDFVLFDICFDVLVVFEMCYCEFSGVGMLLLWWFCCDGDIVCVDVCVCDEVDDGDGYCVYVFVVVVDVLVCEGGWVGMWMMVGGRGTATATRDASRSGSSWRGVGLMLCVMVEVEFGGVCLEVDVWEGLWG